MNTAFREMVDCQVKGPESLCEELISGIRISQSFRCRIDNLYAVQVKFGTYGRRNGGSVVFSLRFKEQPFETVRLVEQLNNLEDNAYHTFEFSPIRKSAGREFVFCIESPNAAHGNNVVLWKATSAFQGQRYVNDRMAKGVICFKTKCLAPKVPEEVSPNSFTVPILKGTEIEQEFTCDHEVIDALSLDLDNYGSLRGSILVDLFEKEGECLFKSRILADQISNGFPLLLPLPPTKTENKTFTIFLSSEDGEPGSVIGAQILKNSKPAATLKINGQQAGGSVSFSVRSAEPDAIAPFDLPSPNVKIMFNQSRYIDSLDPSSKKIGGLVDIITLNYNRADLLLRCYNALTTNTIYPNWKWHICDNGSTDNSVDVISRFQDPRVTITKRPDNSLGFGEANNLIFKSLAQGEYVLFLNNDVIPRINWLSEMLSIMQADPTVGIVGAKLYYPNGSLQHIGVLFQGNKTPVNLSQFFMNPKLKYFSEVDHCFKAVTGACLLMRRTDFEKIGGFPQEYDYGYEDVDLCLNVYYGLNKKVVSCSGAVAVHEEAATSRKVKRTGRASDVVTLKKKWPCEPDQHQYLSDFRHNLYTGPYVSNPLFSIVTCVTRPDMWMENIIRTNRTYSSNIEFKPVFNLIENLPITVAYNRALKSARGKYVIFCHQDLHFYSGWFKILEKFIKSLPNNWGVIGVAGWSLDGKVRGGLRIPEGVWSKEEGEVQTVDECFLVVQKELYFDERIAQPHLYGVDICLESLNRGFKNYALSLPVEHRESGAHPPDWITSYYRALEFIKQKWSARFPLIRATTCVLQQGKPDVVGVKPPRKQ